jgi:hypothetical protein
MQPTVEPNAIAALWLLDFAGIGVPFVAKSYHNSCNYWSIDHCRTESDHQCTGLSNWAYLACYSGCRTSASVKFHNNLVPWLLYRSVDSLQCCKKMKTSPLIQCCMVNMFLLEIIFWSKTEWHGTVALLECPCQSPWNWTAEIIIGQIPEMEFPQWAPRRKHSTHNHIFT